MANLKVKELAGSTPKQTLVANFKPHDMFALFDVDLNFFFGNESCFFLKYLKFSNRSKSFNLRAAKQP
jgi:hypothetical protein